MLESGEETNYSEEQVEETDLRELTVEDFNLPFYMETGFLVSGTACLLCIFALTLLKMLRQR